VEPEGTSRSNAFQPSKGRTIANLQAAIESFLASRKMSQEELAETICGMSRPNFSKVSHGLQGDFLQFVNEKLPASIREDFEQREAKDRNYDPLLSAIEVMVAAAFTALRIAGAKNLPSRAHHMAHADLQQPELERQKRA
jgi:predicted XRE-type DNA-binding protein